MTNKKKLLGKAKNNPNGLNFREFQTLLQQCGWTNDHQKGSHQIWYSPKKYRLSMQKRESKAKGYQVKQFLNRLKEENKNE